MTDARSVAASPASHRRVQRVPEAWPVLHLEAGVPVWAGLRVEGLVRTSRHFDLPALQRLGSAEHHLAVHCVWGWSRPDVRWDGISLGQVLETAGVDGGEDLDDPEWIARIRSDTADFVADRFGLDRMVRELLEVYGLPDAALASRRDLK